VRIADLLLIHPPDLRPTPLVVEKLRGDAPERIASLNDVAIGRRVLHLEIALRESEPRRAREAEREKSCDRLLHDRLVWICAPQSL